MKRRELIKRIRDEAKLHGLTFEMVNERGNHSSWRCGNTLIPLPRHNEISPGVTESVFKAL